MMFGLVFFFNEVISLVQAQVFSECISNVQFAYFGDAVTLDFDAAVAQCSEVGGFVARIDSDTLFNSLQSFFIGLGEFPTIWVGLRDLSDVGGELNASRFDFVDGKGGSKDFFQSPGTFPWIEVEPNDSGGGENCVESQSVSLWNDIACESLHRVVCTLDCVSVTSVPTQSPTQLPTEIDSCRFKALGLHKSLKVPQILA